MLARRKHVGTLTTELPDVKEAEQKQRWGDIDKTAVASGALGHPLQHLPATPSAIGRMRWQIKHQFMTMQPNKGYDSS